MVAQPFIPRPADVLVKPQIQSPLVQQAREISPKSASNGDVQYKDVGEIRQAIKNSPIEGNNGHWEKERGDRVWIPDDAYVPQKNNPENMTWLEIKEEYDIDGIPFKDGDMDLKEVSLGTVKIDEITTDRSDNFDNADIVLAKEKGCAPEDVANWRKEHQYTWHEKADGTTMQKVPRIIHNNVPHSGGVAAAKNRNQEA